MRQISVVANVGGVLAAKFETRRCEASGGRGYDGFAACHRTGEAHARNPRVGHQASSVRMRQMQKLGPMENILKMLPGVNTKMLKDVKMDPKRLKHIEAIVLSMTPAERKKPELLNGSRRVRIAKGAGRTVSEVNKLMDQFREMQKMMKKMGAGGGGKGGGMPRMPFGGGGMFGGR